ncbi:MAG TPA: polysaccharide deacetylase family protein, partial [Candidatus Methanofastidiosa archaeon]|nr:polysaccharide deacetylase family protein [Candidatus Methanofastidiosa archaeon]
MNRKAQYFVVALSIILILSVGIYHAKGDNKSGTYVIFTVDTERDFPPILNTYIGIDEGVPMLLDIFDQYDVKATFLVTGNVAILRPDIVKLISQNHEVGNHSLYHLEPLYTLDYEEKVWRVEESTRILEEIIGENVTSFRAPGHSCDTELVEILQERGYLVESSGYHGDSYPYHPSSDDWQTAGDMDILRVPVSNAPAYFYSFFYYGASWIDAYEYVIEEQEDKDIKVVVIGIHPWELCQLELDDTYESTERVCGDVT